MSFGIWSRRTNMSKLRANIAISLDGYVAGPNQSKENPIGEGGGDLHNWMFPLKVWRESHGEEGGEVNPSSQIVEEWFDNVGAFIMGRNMFGPIRGDWGDETWEGWWGDDPPYHVPVFVLTHHEREPVVKDGGTAFHFVTEGIDSALERAGEVAGDKDVVVAGGAQAIRQYLTTRHLDELELNVVPQLLGAGERLLENVGDVKLEQLRAVEAPGVAHLKYRVVK
jgi:dihydrofolate reductase